MTSQYVTAFAGSPMDRFENMGAQMLKEVASKTLDAAGDGKAIEARVKSIRTQIEDVTSDYDKEKLQERVAKLAGGVESRRVSRPTITRRRS